MSVMTPTRAAPSTSRRLTTEEFLAGYNNDKSLELVAGYVEELPMAGVPHADVEGWLVYFLKQYEMTHPTGRALSGEVHFQTIKHPPTNRLFDVGWISRTRMPTKPDSILYVPPEWIIEVKSPDDTKSNIEEKEIEYFAAGVDVVSLVDPAKKTFRLRRTSGETRLTADDTLTLPDILPGFSLPLAYIFVD